MPEFRPVIDLNALGAASSFTITLPPDSGYAQLGIVGDVNGDGFADLIIGDGAADANGTNSGAAYIVFGTSAGFPHHITAADLDGSNGFRIAGAAAYELAGSDFSAAGDVNGDGFDDILIGAVGADANGDRSGAAYVVFGSAGGFPATVGLADLDGSNGFKISGAAARDFFGGTLSAAGDVNGDGFDDIIVGAVFADGSGSYEYNTGASYVIFGRAAGFPANLDLAQLDGSNGFRITGESSYDYSGARVAGAGDVNGDGFSDLIVTDVPYGGASHTYVVFGKSSGFPADFNLSNLDGSNGFTFNSGGGKYNSDVVASAGDVNGDGFSDIIVGAAFSRQGYAGAANVIFGKAGGFSASLSASNLNGVNGFRIVGLGEYSYAGRSVASAGDVNGDGFDDVLVSARGAYPSDQSFFFVVFGKASGFDSVVELSGIDGSNGFRIKDSGSGVVTAVPGGDLNHDGFDDLIATGGDGTSHIIYGHRALDSVTRTGTAIANTINGGRGADVIRGLDGNDVLIGWEKNDQIFGGSGQDRLSGRTGADILTGGAGGDLLIGGFGHDVFDYNAVADSAPFGAGVDVIRDFHTGDDRIDLSNLGSLSFIGSDAFSSPGQVRAYQSGEDAIVAINLDGAAVREMAIRLEGVNAHALSESDFIL